MKKSESTQTGLTGWKNGRKEEIKHEWFSFAKIHRSQYKVKHPSPSVLGCGLFDPRTWFQVQVRQHEFMSRHDKQSDVESNRSRFGLLFKDLYYNYTDKNNVQQLDVSGSRRLSYVGTLGKMKRHTSHGTKCLEYKIWKEPCRWKNQTHIYSDLHEFSPAVSPHKHCVPSKHATSWNMRKMFFYCHNIHLLWIKMIHNSFNVKSTSDDHLLRAFLYIHWTLVPDLGSLLVFFFFNLKPTVHLDPTYMGLMTGNH